jgi:hypothetical protein
MLQKTLHKDTQRPAALRRTYPSGSVIGMLTDTTIQNLSLDYKRMIY